VADEGAFSNWDVLTSCLVVGEKVESGAFGVRSGRVGGASGLAQLLCWILEAAPFESSPYLRRSKLDLLRQLLRSCGAHLTYDKASVSRMDGL